MISSNNRSSIRQRIAIASHWTPKCDRGFETDLKQLVVRADLDLRPKPCRDQRRANELAEIMSGEACRYSDRRRRSLIFVASAAKPAPSRLCLDPRRRARRDRLPDRKAQTSPIPFVRQHFFHHGDTAHCDDFFGREPHAKFVLDCQRQIDCGCAVPLWRIVRRGRLADRFCQVPEALPRRSFPLGRSLRPPSEYQRNSTKLDQHWQIHPHA